MITSRQLYNKLKDIQVGSPLCRFTEQSCENLLPIIQRIEKLKKEKNAIVLAHNYVAPQILYSVADHTGDSYGLAKRARESSAEIIVFASVRFMAETAKILNPDKIVLDPNPEGGCTLSDGITAEDVKNLRREFPNYTFVCYINTTAEVKALCDTCVTSSNAYRVIERIENDKIYFLPDRLMGENIRKHLKKKGVEKDIALYNGTCYVHEDYQPESVDQVRDNFFGVEILVHPECKPSVVDKADYVGSTSDMLNYVRGSDRKKFFLLTECGLTGILESEFPDRQFVGTCMTCRYMKANSLEHILHALEKPTSSNIIDLDPEIQTNALRCVEKMFSYTEG